MAVPAHQSIRRLTADEALRMVASGIVDEDEPVELLDGVLIEMSPQGPAHSDYWLLDLKARKVELRTAPEAGSYRRLQVLGEGESVSLPELAERWSVRDLLP